MQSDNCNRIVSLKPTKAELDILKQNKNKQTVAVKYKKQ